MFFHDFLALLFFVVLTTSLIVPLGIYIANVFTGKAVIAKHCFGWLERGCYKIGGINPEKEMSWIEYGKALLWFNVFGCSFLFILQLVQGYLPLNPQHFGVVSWPLALNTAISFITNTNWQAYSGENTLSYLTQMIGLTSQNFLSAATGMATFLALTRGFTRKTTDTIGNFWVDFVRTIVYLFLPLSIIMALFLVGSGSTQTLSPYVEVITLEGAKQTIPRGPVASQVAIKQLGTNGGGFFNANSAHPFENPTPWTNLIEMLAILLIPTASVYAYGILIGSKKHGLILLLTMFTLWVIGIAISYIGELMHNQIMEVYPVLEGKETRFGTMNSLLWSVSTSGTSNGSVNAMLSSLSALAGGIALFNIMLGELIFGGIGVGMCSIIMFILLTVFLSGLMVGRTPEYWGKKIEKREIQWMMVAILVPGATILIGAGISCVLPEALSSLGNQGPHGLSEILYAFASCAGNNGSAFSGLNANTTYYNLMLTAVMLITRTAIILPSLAIAGLLAKKKTTPPSVGTFSTDSPLFFVLLTGVILIVGALTFFPALSLGPIVEHLLMLRGQSF